MRRELNKYDAADEYRRWLEDRIIEVPLMTNTQYKFARMLFEEENFKLMSSFGDLDIIYNSIRKHLKP
jgi:hypothetical protein